MQIFTVEMIIELLKQINEMKSLLYEAIFLAAWSNVIDSIASVVSATIPHDWDGVLVGIFMVISGAILLYRLVISNLLSAIEVLLGK